MTRLPARSPAPRVDSVRTRRGGLRGTGRFLPHLAFCLLVVGGPLAGLPAQGESVGETTLADFSSGSGIGVNITSDPGISHSW